MSQIIADLRDRYDHYHVIDRYDDGEFPDRHGQSDRCHLPDQCDRSDHHTMIVVISLIRLIAPIIRFIGNR
jgi:hypothetical protein